MARVLWSDRSLHKKIVPCAYPYLIIGLQGLESRTGPQRAGPMGGACRVGHWESGNTPGYVRAQRGRARRALFSRVEIRFNMAIFDTFWYLQQLLSFICSLELKSSKILLSAPFVILKSIGGNTLCVDSACLCIRDNFGGLHFDQSNLQIRKKITKATVGHDLRFCCHHCNVL